MTAPHADQATGIAASVRSGRASASAVVQESLARIRDTHAALNAFTAIFDASAMAAAGEIDDTIARGIDPGPLAGVPFAVKNLFDVAGRVTVAGSKIRRSAPAARRDATVVGRLRDAGAILVGATNMDEFAYGFTTENEHDGATRNPHDPARSAGGSSGGSAAAVAAGLVPISLGTDTNGSVRVPASLCGVFGLKPTLGRLSRTGVFPFVGALDHVGAFAGSARDLATLYDLMQGADPRDPACRAGPVEPTLDWLDRPGPFRAARLGGWFQETAGGEGCVAMDRVAQALDATGPLVLDGVAEARAAAFCLTAASGAALHLETLRHRAAELDAATRPRLMAGALLPAVVLDRAAQLRVWFRDQLRQVFRSHDVLIAPATPCVAPLLGQTMLRLGDREVPLRPNLGLYTQPISFIGLPVVTVPVVLDSSLPIGVQIIAPAWNEGIALAVAAFLERAGVVEARAPLHRLPAPAATPTQPGTPR